MLRRRRELRNVAVLLSAILPLRFILLPAMSREDSLTAAQLWSSGSDPVIPPYGCRLSSQAVDLVKSFQPRMELRFQLTYLISSSSRRFESHRPQCSTAPHLTDYRSINTTCSNPSLFGDASTSPPLKVVLFSPLWCLFDGGTIPLRRRSSGDHLVGADEQSNSKLGLSLISASLPSLLGVEDANCWLSLLGLVSTGSVFFRGIPLTVSPPFTSTHGSYCLSSPSPSLPGLFLKHLVPIRESKSLCSTVSQPMSLWGVLISLINFLKISVGFSGIFTETYSLAMSHLSCAKKLQQFHLPVDSSGPSSLSSSTSFSLEKRSALSYVSFLRSVSPPNVKWRCMPISIIVCLSCVAVCSGPEDTTDFFSTLIRGADWVSTSYFNVTITKVSSIAVKLTSTHSSSLNSLSLYPRGFSTSITYVALSFAVRACLNSIPICNPSV